MVSLRCRNPKTAWPLVHLHCEETPVLIYIGFTKEEKLAISKEQIFDASLSLYDSASSSFSGGGRGSRSSSYEGDDCPRAQAGLDGPA